MRRRRSPPRLTPLPSRRSFHALAAFARRKIYCRIWQNNSDELRLRSYIEVVADPIIAATQTAHSSALTPVPPARERAFSFPGAFLSKPGFHGQGGCSTDTSVCATFGHPGYVSRG